MRHCTCPRVQHRREADLRAETLRVGGDHQQGLRRRLEQEIVDHGLVLIRDGADARRQREHDVEVGHLQQLGLARLHPLAGLAALALRTMAIAAAVVGNGGVAARRVRAARNMPAKGRRAAALDRAHHLHLRMGEMAAHGTTPCGTVIAENLRDLQRWTAHVYRGLLRRLLPGGERRELIEWAQHIAQNLARDVGVACCRVEL